MSPFTVLMLCQCPSTCGFQGGGVSVEPVIFSLGHLHPAIALALELLLQALNADGPVWARVSARLVHAIRDADAAGEPLNSACRGSRRTSLTRRPTDSQL